jgi:hypothetical protein
MAEEGELPRESSLLSEGQSPQAEPPCHESEDPNLRGAVATGGGEEPLRLQELDHSERAEESRPQQMVGSPPPVPQPNTAETMAARKRPCPMTVGSSLSEPS